ncbi:hypothetical protein MAPG_02989 [Magnaporthiopsis poae ATCC 64411]|uniref:Uncharacterized protein n=1 Tax=Magnaporthiopsis poae (strain ATCC 64411 / 73-15) TaxID=644358 RepID=A0A0C4DSU8_MAGP6|nr:hypothetical protein MAPG_02989 [Magnaporthiopsis poae ATCC 64411]
MSHYDESPLIAAEARRRHRMLAIAKVRQRIAEEKYGGADVRQKRRRTAPQIIDAADYAILGISRNRWKGQPEPEPETASQAARYASCHNHRSEEGGPRTQSPPPLDLEHRHQADDTPAGLGMTEQSAAAVGDVCDGEVNAGPMWLSWLSYLVIVAAGLVFVVVALRRLVWKGLVLPAMESLFVTFFG